MKKRSGIRKLVCLTLLAAAGCGRMEQTGSDSLQTGTKEESSDRKIREDQTDVPLLQDSAQQSPVTVTEGTEDYRGFLLDNVLHSETEGEIHYHIHVPDSYDGTTPCALFVTLPGYELPGVPENLWQ